MGNSHSISDCMAGGGSIEDDLITIPAEVTNLFHSLDNSKIKRIRDELKAVDFIFLFDNSERERERLVPHLPVLNRLLSLATYYDDNGVDLYLTQSPRHIHLKRDEAGCINDASRADIEKYLWRDEDEKESSDDYEKEYETEPDESVAALLTSLLKGERGRQGDRRRKKNYIVIVPSCDASMYYHLQANIKATCEWMLKSNIRKTQIGVQFVQLGDDLKTEHYLKLLDEAVGSKLDIVDSTSITPPTLNQVVHNGTIVKVLLGGIVRRIDEGGFEKLFRVPWAHKSYWFG